MPSNNAPLSSPAQPPASSSPATSQVSSVPSPGGQPPTDTREPHQRVADAVAESRIARLDPLHVGNLPESVRVQMAMQRQMRNIIAELRSTSWGQAITPQMAQLVAAWCSKYNIDGATEVFVLGGNIYLNANFYARHLVPLTQAGVIVAAWADHVHDDARLQTDDFRAERTRRAHERIIHGIPDKDTLPAGVNLLAACAFHVWVPSKAAPGIAPPRVGLREMPDAGVVEFVGAKYVTDAKRPNDASKYKDPVGVEFPSLTAESRSIRRAMRMVATHVPQVRPLLTVSDEAEILSERLTEERAQLKERERSLISLPDQPTGPRMLNAGEYGGETIPKMEQQGAFAPGGPPIPAANLEPLTPPGLPMREPEPLPDVNYGGGQVPLAEAAATSGGAVSDSTPAPDVAAADATPPAGAPETKAAGETPTRMREPGEEPEQGEQRDVFQDDRWLKE